jgi:hypothetical protein
MKKVHNSQNSCITSLIKYTHNFDKEDKFLKSEDEELHVELKTLEKWPLGSSMYLKKVHCGDVKWTELVHDCLKFQYKLEANF